MKACYIILMLALTCVQLQATDRELFLRQIDRKEDSRGKVGKRGELGWHHLIPANVRKYGGYGHAEAMAHLDHIIRLFKERGIDPNPYNLALAWNAGEYNVGRKQLPMQAYAYAAKVSALYAEATIMAASSSRVVVK